MTNPFALDAPATPPAPVALATPAPVTATAPVAPASEVDPFGAPAPQEPRGPRVRDMYGRLLLIVPIKVEIVPNRLQPGTTQDRMTADVVILDGPCPYGGKPEATPPVPHNKMASVPHKINRMYISGVGLISQCRNALTEGKPVLGRLGVGEAKEPGQNAPYLLSPATDADKAIGRQYLTQVDPFA